MSDGGPGTGLPFQPKEEEYSVVEIEENMQNPDGYGLDDRSRCKRRKRCGQCGPCQVKENCMKCHFCIRKDVLKQTCIYRKCVYLRSKPKPYSRPHHSPQVAGRISPGRDMVHPPQMVKSPPVSTAGHHRFGPDQSMQMSDIRPENPFLQHLPHQQQPPLGAIPNQHGFSSPPNPMMPSSNTNTSSLNMSMQMNMAPQLQNHASSPPLHKLSDHSSPHVNSPPLVNSPPGAPMSIPQVSSVGSVPQVPGISPVVSSVPPVLPTITSSSLPGMHPIPSIPTMSGMNDRPAINEFRHPEQLPFHHPHHPFPPVPGVHPHMPHRDTNLFGDHARIPHMNFNPTNHIDTFSRGPGDSSCMYHPGLPYSMPGPFQPSGPSFLSGAAEMNPFRSNFINSFPPGYSYPPDRYRDSFGSLPFPRLGMSTPSFPQYPGQGAGYAMGNSFSQQYSPYNSQHGCPKNGSRPPVSPNIDDVKVLQEGYDNEKDGINDKCDSVVKVEPLSPRDEFNNNRASSPTDSEHSRLWNYYGVEKTLERSSSRYSATSKSSGWEPWRLPYLFSPRRDDAWSRTCSSTVSSDFECEISVDDHSMNALIRSDGCNNLEIEFDRRSMLSEDASPRKLASGCSAGSEIWSPVKGTSARSLSQSDMKERGGVKRSLQKCTPESQIVTKAKSLIKGTVFLRQDLGDEGTVQLELPGHRVSIENIEVTEEYLKKSSNVEELREFLSKQVDVSNDSA